MTATPRSIPNAPKMLFEIEPAYPPSQEATILSDYGLKALIASKALPEAAAAQKRRKSYTGIYILTQWGIPYFKAELSETNGELVYTPPMDTGPLTEAEPGVFFTPSGDTFDTRGPVLKGLNLRLVKVNSRALPYKIASMPPAGSFSVDPVRLAGIRRDPAHPAEKHRPMLLPFALSETPGWYGLGYWRRWPHSSACSAWWSSP